MFLSYKVHTMAKLHKADSTAAHVARILVIVFGMLEFGVVLDMFLMMICVGWDESFEYSAIMILTVPYAFTLLFVIGVAFLPFARSWERGVVVGLVVAEFAAMLTSIGASIWRGVLYGTCDDSACTGEKDCVLTILVLNCILAGLSAFNMAFALLLYVNVRRNPDRAAALQAKAELAPNPHVQLVIGGDDVGREDTDDEETRRPPPRRKKNPPPVPEREEEPQTEDEFQDYDEESGDTDQTNEADDDEEPSVLSTTAPVYRGKKSHNVSTARRREVHHPDALPVRRPPQQQHAPVHHYQHVAGKAPQTHHTPSEQYNDQFDIVLH